MSFDRTKPVNGTTVDADLLRNNMNDLDTRDAATNQRIDNIQLIPGPQGPQGIPGNDGAPGPQGPQGEPGPNAFPHTGDAEINGNLKTANGYIQGELGLGMSDIGGSGESGLKISASNNGAGYVPRFAGCQNGANQYAFAIDGSGISDNMGTPSVQDGDLLRYDAMTSTWKPFRMVIRTIQALDENGNALTLQVLCPYVPA